jgi:hypothetical protein
LVLGIGKKKYFDLYSSWKGLILISNANVVSRRPLTAEARVSPRVIYGRQSGTGTGFSQSFSVFPCHHPTVTLHTLILLGGQEIGPLVAAVPKRPHPMDVKKVRGCQPGSDGIQKTPL